MNARARLSLLAAAALGLAAACSNSGAATCAKARECCGKVKDACEWVGREGEGYEDRCAIDFDARIDSWATYGKEACDAIADAYGEYAACLGDVTCDDVGEDGKVTKCNTQAIAYCQALKNSGDGQCGGDWHDISCDNYKADLY